MKFYTVTSFYTFPSSTDRDFKQFLSLEKANRWAEHLSQAFRKKLTHVGVDEDISDKDIKSNLHGYYIVCDDWDQSADIRVFESKFEDEGDFKNEN